MRTSIFTKFELFYEELPKKEKLLKKRSSESDNQPKVYHRFRALSRRLQRSRKIVVLQPGTFYH